MSYNSNNNNNRAPINQNNNERFNKLDNGVLILEIEGKDKTFVMGKIKARNLKRAIEISEKFQKQSFGSKDLDDFILFFCECYNNQFSIDDVYDGMEAKKLLPLIGKTIAAITGKMGEY